MLHQISYQLFLLLLTTCHSEFTRLN